MALSHLVLLLVLMYILFSILTIFYSNYLIVYFNLQERFPRLKTILEYRMKFQRYYIIYNIVVAILLMVFFYYY